MLSFNFNVRHLKSVINVLIVLLSIAVVRYRLQVVECRPLLVSGDAIWRVELKCLKDARVLELCTLFYLSISCLKLTHSFNVFNCTRKI